MHRPVQIGIVGLGFGQQVLVPAFRIDPRCVVAGVCAGRFDRAQAVAHTLQIPRAYRDAPEMLADPDITAVAIAAPPAVQARVALAAARAGKHLFCEKPLALDAVQGEQIVSAARGRGIAHAMDFEFPEVAAWQHTRRILQAGTLGRLRHATLNWQVETFSYRTRSDSWRTQAESGGGSLNNLGSHAFYNLEWLLGPIARLAARLSPPASAVEARVDLWLEMAAGFPVTVVIAADAFPGAGHRLEIYGDDGSLRLENQTSDHLRGFTLDVATRPGGKFTRFDTGPEAQHQDGRIVPVSRLVSRFLDAIGAGGAVTPNLQDGLRVQTLIDVARASQRAGIWQEVAPR